MPTKTDAPKRFELPALNFNFESLTDGTNIPPPLPSPKQEDAPVLPVSKTAPSPALTATAAPLAAATTTPSKPAATATSLVNGNGNGMIFSSPMSTYSNTPLPSSAKFRSPSPLAGSKRSAVDDASMSSSSTPRHGTIRRLLSRSLLNYAYAEDKASTTSLGTSARPDSRSNASMMDDNKKAKRRSGWFQRLRSSDTAPKRSSLIFSTPEEPTKPAGPPPPMIPEIRSVETKIDLGNAGTISDESFFKNFK